MIVVAGISLLLLLAGTYLIGFHLYVWDGALLLGLGLLGMMLALRPLTGPVRRGPGTQRTVTWSEWSRLWGRAGAILLAVTVGLAARNRPAEADFTLLFVFWLLAVAWFVATLGFPLLHRPWLATSLSRAERMGLAALLVAAFAVRAIALGRIPYNFGGDEGTQALAALQLVARPLGNPFATGWFAVPTMSFALYGVAMRLCGATMAGARALSALVGTLTVLTTFLLGRSLGGRRVGWVAAVTVACSAYAIHFSRLASNQIFDPLIGTLAIWLLWEALRRDEQGAATVLWWGLSGMVAGLGWYLYFGARWVTLLLGLILVWRALVEPRFLARHRQGLGVLGAGWLVVAAPLGVWYTAHPADLTARYNQVSIFASGWLTQAMQVTGKSALALLIQQLWKAATAFHLTPDPTFWYYPNAPLADFVTGALMLVGLLAALRRWRWPARGLTLLWFGSTLLMAWGLTENPPSSQRGLLLVPAFALLVAWGTEALWELGARYRAAVRRAVVLLLALAVTWNLVFYFLIYTPRRIYGNPTSEAATAIVHFVESHPRSGAVVYLIGPPYLYWGFGGFAFLLRDQPGQDVEAGQVPTGISSPARFVFVEARLGELGAFQAAYPGGQLTTLTSSNGRPLALIYDW